MNTSPISCLPPELGPILHSELCGLDPREQFAASLHGTTEAYVSQGGAPEDAAYFLIAAARAALDQQTGFSPNSLLAREYLQAALELL